MSARIVIGQQPRPIIGGRWHLIPDELWTAPQTGEPITTLCGRTEPVEYVTDDYPGPGEPPGPVRACWKCDYAYQQENGFEIWPGHPCRPENQPNADTEDRLPLLDASPAVPPNADT